LKVRRFKALPPIAGSAVRSLRMTAKTAWLYKEIAR
jgi:hypothetical protein